jgi:nascent polypeptide-associated complex subunit beta
MLSNTVLALSLLPVTFAHFQLNWPAGRGFSEDTEGTFPCGGYNDVQQQRTDFPINGAPIQLHMEHPQTNVAVYMAIGDNPGDGFSIVAKQQLTVDGLGDFCFGSVSVPAGLNVSDGTKASIQVVSNNHESGGLYQVSYLILNQVNSFANNDAVRRCHVSQHPVVRERLQHQLQEQHGYQGQQSEHCWQP